MCFICNCTESRNSPIMSAARIIKGKQLIYLAGFLNQRHPSLIIAILAEFHFCRNV